MNATSGRVFCTVKPIRFSHCDPAGIVYYPRYLDLLHETQEDWLTHIGHPEHELISKGLGIPIVSLHTEFKGMSRFGDVVVIALTLDKLGNSSIGMRYKIHSCSRTIHSSKGIFSIENQEWQTMLTGGELGAERLSARGVVVLSAVPHGQPQRVHGALRDAMTPYLSNEPPPEEKPHARAAAT